MTVAAPERRIIPVPPETLQRARATVFSNLVKNTTIETPSLEDFFIQAWPIIEPGTPLQNNWSIGYVAEHLEAVAAGEITRLAISIPPREAKSNLVTILFPDWVWITRAWKRFMAISYSQTLATEHSVKRRRVIDSPWFQEKWGTIFQLQQDQNTKSFFENTAGGAMLATSAGGAGTGKGANIQIFDDFINPKEAESETERKDAIESYKHTFSNRLNDPKKDARIIVAQRTHRDDLTGYVLKEEGDYVHIELPIVASKRIEYSFPLSKKVHVTEVGDILNPARHDTNTIAKQKRASGSRAFSAQYLCTPSKDDGSMCPQSWWHFYKEEPRDIANRAHVKAQSWDFAFKDSDDSSWVVGLVGVKTGANIYVCHEKRDHMDFTSTCKAVMAMSSQWPMTSFKFYEDRANGPAVKSALQKKVPGLIAVEPLGSKEARFAAASPTIESGNVLLPYPYDHEGNIRPDRQWVIDLMEEVERFPEEPNDRGDALSQLIVKLLNVQVHEEDQNEEGGSILMNGDSGNDDIAAIDLNGIDNGFMNGGWGGDDGTL